MNARVVNGIVWGLAIAALAVHSLSQGWDAVSAAGSIFGYSVLCAALWLAIDKQIRERD